MSILVRCCSSEENWTKVKAAPPPTKPRSRRTKNSSSVGWKFELEHSCFCFFVYLFLFFVYRCVGSMLFPYPPPSSESLVWFWTFIIFLGGFEWGNGKASFKVPIFFFFVFVAWFRFDKWHVSYVNSFVCVLVCWCQIESGRAECCRRLVRVHLICPVTPSVCVCVNPTVLLYRQRA